MRAQCVVLAVLLGSSSLAGAANILVTSTADNLTAGDGACTLREAIINANTNTDATAGDCAAGGGEDLINVPAGTYSLQADPVEHEHAALYIADNLTVYGSGPATTRIEAQGLANAFWAGARLRLRRLSISSDSTAVFSNSPIEIESVVLTANDGYGARLVGSDAQIMNSAIHGNKNGIAFYAPDAWCDYGVCICVATAWLRIYNSTVSANENGVHVGGGCGEASIVNSTIVDNTVQGLGGNLRILGMRNSVVAHNGVGLNCGGPPFSGGDPASGGHNIDSDGTCGLTDPTDLSNVDPLLGPLQDNGGPTPTHALLRGSPAIDAITIGDCTWDADGDPGTPDVPLTTDQRGVRRPQGAGCDIGAFEATACSDGVDNDSDGLVDYPADPGCRLATSTLERTQCQDGLNNDGQTGIDFDGGASVNGGVPLDVRDPQCTNGWQNKERSGCGLGFELVFLTPLLARLTRRRRA